MTVNFLPLAAVAQKSGGSFRGSEEEKLAKLYAMLLAKESSDTTPIKSHWEGVNKLAQAAMAAALMRQQADQERSNTSAMGSLTFGGTAAAPQAASPMGGFLGNLFGGGGSSPATASDLGGPDIGAPIMTPKPVPTPPMTQGAGLPQEALSPVPLDQQKPPMQGGQLPVGIDRSRFSQELGNNPALINKMAAMVRGEVGLGRNPDQEKVQTESAFNRAQARNIPLAQALLSVSEDPKRGYYARDTYRPIDQKSIQYFKDKILPAVMGGSDLGTKFLGSPVTGNGSQMDFAGRRAAQGMYDNSKWYSGVPGRGEMFVTEKGDAARFARNAPVGPIVPPELMNPQPMAPVGSMAPTQVASANPNFVPQPQPQANVLQQMAQAGFQPGQLPDVPNVAVRPAGIPRPGAQPMTVPQFASPPPRQPAQNAPQIVPPPQFGGVPQVDNRAAIQQKFDQTKALYQQAIRSGNTSLAKQLLEVGGGLQQQLLKSPEQQWEAFGDTKIIDKKSGRVFSEPSGKATHGVVGKDQFGNDIYGWTDPVTRKVTYDERPNTDIKDSAIPPTPPGVDPKVWRDTLSKRASENAAPPDRQQITLLRKEIQDVPSYKNIAAAAPVYKSMRDAAGRDTRAADVNMIYGMAKLMDPGSVVRESEMTVAQAVATLPQYIQSNIMSQMTTTGRLNPDVRQAIMEEAHSRMSSYKIMFDQDASMFSGIAKRNGMNLEDVIPNFGSFEPYTKDNKGGTVSPFDAQQGAMQYGPPLGFDGNSQMPGGPAPTQQFQQPQQPGGWQDLGGGVRIREKQ